MTINKKKAAEQKKPIGRVPIAGCRCHCGYEWAYQGTTRPEHCPKCKSWDWDKPQGPKSPDLAS
ncbi:hypothetical protein KIH39_11965 [Telmatocola sphagniphila]|uniref:Uncharacterized protein n=1 Tax=Telmatocola sphagniphila TaxID=1123043 RepID=A0A8E6B9Y2_9BACT|nr:hypothetical protein [Telmatocola sphagniphila]QVL34587.1 hypothetical protein KIH39_11965 [Telmatocola sphagniphila]